MTTKPAQEFDRRKPSPLRQCDDCLHRDSRDSSCMLTGETKRRGDAACFDWTDGRVDARELTAEIKQAEGGE